MRQPTEQFWGKPSWPLIRYTTVLAIANSVWFGLVYGGADILTHHRTLRVRVDFSWEQHIPLVPAASLIYMSIYLLFVAAPFVLRRREEIRALVLTLMTVTGIAGICFLLLPAESAYPPPQNLRAWAGLFSFADWLNLRYNMLPSLHVALSVVCIACFAARAPAAGKMLLWLWAAALCASTLLTHQHHVLDVVTGFGLALAGYRFVYRRLVS